MTKLDMPRRITPMKPSIRKIAPLAAEAVKLSAAPMQTEHALRLGANMQIKSENTGSVFMAGDCVSF